MENIEDEIKITLKVLQFHVSRDVHNTKESVSVGGRRRRERKSSRRSSSRLVKAGARPSLVLICLISLLNMARMVDVHDDNARRDSVNFTFNDAALPSTVSDALAQVIIAQSQGDAEDWGEAAARIVTELKTRIPELLRDVRYLERSYRQNLLAREGKSPSRVQRTSARVCMTDFGTNARAFCSHWNTGGTKHPRHYAATLTPWESWRQPHRRGGQQRGRRCISIDFHGGGQSAFAARVAAPHIRGSRSRSKHNDIVSATNRANERGGFGFERGHPLG